MSGNRARSCYLISREDVYRDQDTYCKVFIRRPTSEGANCGGGGGGDVRETGTPEMKESAVSRNFGSFLAGYNSVPYLI